MSLDFAANSSFNPIYSFATLNFKTHIIWSKIIHSLKYPSYRTWQKKGIRKFEFVTNTQFLFMTEQWTVNNTFKDWNAKIYISFSIDLVIEEEEVKMTGLQDGTRTDKTIY